MPRSYLPTGDTLPPHPLQRVIRAFLHDEPCADTVAQALDSAQVPAENWAEVLQKSLWRQADIIGMVDEFIGLGWKFA